LNLAAPGDSFLSAADEHAARYEELRREVLENGYAGRWGLNLVLRRGLAAWMQTAGKSRPPSSSPAIAVATSMTVKGQFVDVLVDTLLCM
jgi:hypothetical protein